MTFDSSKNVLIVGGGLAGLALANVLKHQGVPYKVFERDASIDVRTQGWSLSVHFCLWTLKNSIDPAKYATLGEKAAVDPDHPHRGDFCMVDGNKDERLLKIGSVPGVDVFRVNRERFRGWLMEGIDVQWSKRIDHYTVKDYDGGVQVTFTDGTVEEGSMLVGADGVNSQVCRQLLGAEDFDKATTVNPIRILAGSYWIDSEMRRKFEETLSPAHMIAIASASDNQEHSTCFFSSLIDVDHSRGNPYEMLWSVSCLDENEPRYETDHERMEQAKNWVEKAGFQGLLRRLVLEAPEDSVVTPLTVRERSPHPKLDTFHGPVVLIGDAAHTMTQYRGEGANHAIQDACLLGMELASVYKEEKTLNEAIAAYNKEMLPRGRKAVAQSHEAVRTMHGPRTAVIEHLRAQAKAIEERIRKMISNDDASENITKS